MRSAAIASRQVALLRGLNLAGHHKLPMKALSELFTAAGAHAVQTYIQSGNVVFQCERKAAPRIAAAVSASIQKRYGFAAPILLRTAAQLRRVVQSSPFLASGADPASLHVIFLAAAPDPDVLLTVRRELFLPDEFAVFEKQVYLRLPNGMGRAKLPMILGSKLGAGCTTRNWRTVMMLLDMLEA